MLISALAFAHPDAVPHVHDPLAFGLLALWVGVGALFLLGARRFLGATGA